MFPLQLDGYEMKIPNSQTGSASHLYSNPFQDVGAVGGLQFLNHDNPLFYNTWRVFKHIKGKIDYIIRESNDLELEDC